MELDVDERNTLICLREASPDRTLVNMDPERRPRYALIVERTLLHRIHNPHNSVCGCDADCWCRRTAVGRAVKWWFPARYFGIRHKNSWFGTTFKGWTDDQIREWKRDQNEGMHSIAGHQPKYEKIVRLGPMRFGMTVRLSNGDTVVHELSGRPRLDFGP